MNQTKSVTDNAFELRNAMLMAIKYHLDKFITSNQPCKSTPIPKRAILSAKRAVTDYFEYCLYLQNRPKKSDEKRKLAKLKKSIDDVLTILQVSATIPIGMSDDGNVEFINYEANPQELLHQSLLSDLDDCLRTTREKIDLFTIKHILIFMYKCVQ